MRALFTMLFGASTVLIAERAEGGKPGPAETHYRRMGWLFVFGMLHAYFLWWGDILVTYAIAGLFIFPFRKLRPRLQVAIGLVVLTALLVANLIEARELTALHAAAVAPGASAAAIRQWQDVSIAIAPPHSLIGEETAAYRGGFMEALRARTRVASLVQTLLMPTSEIPEAIGQMFLGMALFRTGFFTLKWSTRAYLGMIAVGYLAAVPTTAWLAWRIQDSGFDPFVLNRLEAWQQVTRPLIGLAHAGVILLIVRGGSAPAVENIRSRPAAPARSSSTMGVQRQA